MAPTKKTSTVIKKTASQKPPKINPLDAIIAKARANLAQRDTGMVPAKRCKTDKSDVCLDDVIDTTKRAKPTSDSSLVPVPKLFTKNKIEDFMAMPPKVINRAPVKVMPTKPLVQHQTPALEKPTPPAPKPSTLTEMSDQKEFDVIKRVKNISSNNIRMSTSSSASHKPTEVKTVNSDPQDDPRVKQMLNFLDDLKSILINRNYNIDDEPATSVEIDSELSYIALSDESDLELSFTEVNEIARTAMVEAIIAPFKGYVLNLSDSESDSEDSVKSVVKPDSVVKRSSTPAYAINIDEETSQCNEEDFEDFRTEMSASLAAKADTKSVEMVKKPKAAAKQHQEKTSASVFVINQELAKKTTIFLDSLPMDGKLKKRTWGGKRKATGCDFECGAKKQKTSR